MAAISRAAAWIVDETGMRFLARRKPAAIIAVVTMALALGGNSLVFSITKAFLLTSFGVPEPSRLGVVAPVRELPGRGSVVFAEAYPNYLMIREAQRSFADVACISSGVASWQVGEEARPLQMARVTASFFATTAVHPVLGRGFEQAEEGPNPAAVVVLSHALWQRAFGGRASVLGEPMVLNGVTHTVVGVMPVGFTHPLPTDVWLPFDVAPTAWKSITGARSLTVYGRLREGVTLEAAAADMAALTARALEASPDNRDFTYTFQGIRQVLVPNADRILLFVQAGALLLVLLAVANLASLLIAWGFDRRQEIAVRLALGAGDYRIVRMLVLQSVLVVMAGGMAGLLLTRVALPWIQQLPVATPLSLFFAHAELDGAVLLWTAGAIAAAGILAGLVPALLTRKANLSDALRASSRSVTLSRTAVRWQQAMVLAQATLSVVIVAMATMIGLSFRNLNEVPLGFAREGRAVARIQLQGERYATPEARAQFGEQLTQQLANVGNIDAHGFTWPLPVGDGVWGGRFWVSLEDAAAGAEPLLLHFRRISPSYLDAVGIPLLRGRSLEERDRADQPAVAIVSEAAANRLWPGENAVGKPLYRVAAGGPPLPLEVVGVVGNVMDAGSAAPPGETVYIPYAQNAVPFMSIVVHAATSADAMAAIRGAVQRVDPSIAASGIDTLDRLVGQANALPRLQTVLLLLFATVAASMVSLGSYGVMSQLVANREREFALRLALGARPARLGGTVLLQIGRLTALGAAAGALIAWLLRGVIQPLVFGIAPGSITVLVTVSFAVVALGAVAAFAPASRAMRIDVRSVTVAP